MNVLIISNMYPDINNPGFGIFVKNFEDILSENKIESKRIVLKKERKKLIKVVNYFFYYIKIFINLVFRKYDIIYIHYASHNAIPVLLASKFRKFNLYTNVHGSDVMQQTRIQNFLKPSVQKLLNLSNKIITPSEYFKDYVSVEYLIDKNRIFVYPSGGVDINIFNRFTLDKIQELRKVYGFKKEEYIIGFVGRLNSKKGWKTFLRAIHKIINDKKINVKVLMVADGEEKKLFENMLEELKLKNKITLLPLLSKNKLSEVYNIIDILCFPTFQESLGLVAIECLSCGTPVIGTNIRPVTDYIENGVNGFLFEKDNSNELIKKIEEYYLLSVEEKNRLKENSIISVEKFSKDNTEKILINLINNNY